MHNNRFSFKPVQLLQYQHLSDGQKSDINIASEFMHAFFQQTNRRHHPLLTTMQGHYNLVSLVDHRLCM